MGADSRGHADEPSRSDPAASDPFILYRLIDDVGRLLYVGMTANLPRRIAKHSEREWWPEVVAIKTVAFPDARSCATAERNAIATEHPVHNLAGVTSPYIPYPSEPLADRSDLEALTAYQREMEAVHAQRDEAIRAARAAGHTWTEIGVALGISHAGAMKAARR